MVSKNLGRQIDAGQYCSYNDRYSILKTVMYGVVFTPNVLRDRRWVWVCLSAQSRVDFRSDAQHGLLKDLRRNSRTTSKEFSNS
jgi:hypothetical protein